MAWFIHHSSRIRLSWPTSPDQIELLVANLAQELRRLKARRINVAGSSVTFSAGAFRLVTNMNPLNFVTRGRIGIVQEGESFYVAYRISFFQVPIIVTVMVLLLGAWMTWHRFPLPLMALFLPFVWLWLVGFSRLLGALGFDYFIRTLVKTAGGVLSD